jgi:hypothetical protein
MKLDVNDIQIGDELYVSDVWSIDNGWTDQCGGIAVVERIQRDNYKNVFIHFKGLTHHAPNAEYVLENQEKWEKEYGNRLAHDCPEGTPCPNPTRNGGIKKSAARQLVEAVNEARSSALRSKLMRQSRRELE